MRSKQSRSVAARFAVGAAALALIAGACGSDDDTGGTGDTSDTGDTEVTETDAVDDGSDATDAPDESTADTADDGDGEAAAPTGDLRVGARAAFVTWDPMASRKEADLAYYAPVYEGLFELDLNGELQPQLVDTYEVTSEYIEMTLVDGVTFHDGTPFDAEAVKFNIERVRDNPGYSQGTVASVSDVEIIDPLTVRLNLSEPSPQIPFGLARLGGLMVSPAAVEAGTLVDTPIGTGPWMANAAESQAGVELVFDYYPDYRDPSAAQVATVHIFPEVDGPSPFAAGDLDIGSFNSEDRAQMEQVGATIAEGPNIGRSFVFIDRGPGGVFEDVRLRQAVSYAIDREAFKQVALSGTGNPQAVPATGSDYGAADDLVGLEYDPEKAQALMAEAGVDEINFTLPVYGPFVAQGEALQAILAESNINLELVQIESTVGMVQSCASGDYAACIIPDDSVHPAQIQQRYVGPDAVLNPAGVAYDDVEAAADAAFAEPDLDAGEELWTEYFRTVFEQELPMTYIVRELNMVAYNADTLNEGVEVLYRVQAGVNYRTVSFR